MAVGAAVGSINLSDTMYSLEEGMGCGKKRLIVFF
jgi:hypothetical protein